MKIHKIGHCCLLIEIDGKKILTDPGMFSSEQTSLRGVDVVVITHSHADHLDPKTIKQIAKNNPKAVFVGNEEVGSILDEKSIIYDTISHGEMREVAGVRLKAFKHPHAPLYKGVERPDNTGYLIAERLYLPGDSLVVPDVGIEILALPVSAPWCKTSEVIDYALHVKPQKAFPIHDGMLAVYGGYHMHPSNILSEKGIEFIALKPGEDLKV